jgi:hypothetical protein
LALISIAGAGCVGDSVLANFVCVDSRWTVPREVVLSVGQQVQFVSHSTDFDIVGDLILPSKASILVAGSRLSVQGKIKVAEGASITVDTIRHGYLTAGDLEFTSSSIIKVLFDHPSQLIEGPDDIDDFPAVVVSRNFTVAGKVEVSFDRRYTHSSLPINFTVIAFGTSIRQFKEYSGVILNPLNNTITALVTPIYTEHAFEVNVRDPNGTDGTSGTSSWTLQLTRGMIYGGVAVVLVLGVAIFAAVFVIGYRRARNLALVRLDEQRYGSELELLHGDDEDEELDRRVQLSDDGSNDDDLVKS